MRLRQLLAVVTLATMCAGCGLGPGKRDAFEYDFGFSTEPAPAPRRIAREIAVADVLAPAWLESNAMIYRLAYQEAARPRAYANSRWVASPAQLLTSRLRSRAAAAAMRGIAPLGEPLRGAATLATEVEEMSQVFDAPDKSRAVVRLRATLTDRGKLLAQQSFTVERDAASADAAGGARAMASAADAVVGEIVDWVGGVLQN